MKLANALAERADIQVRIARLKDRLVNNAKVQEGDQPAEDPNMLLEELSRLIERLEELITQINLTNSQTMSEGRSITELIAKRDCLNKKIAILRIFLNTASEKTTRYSQREVLIKSTVNVSKLQKDVDMLSKELRLLDDRIQELNWLSELK